MTSHHRGMAASSMYEVTPNKRVAASASAQQSYYHHAPTTSSSTAADASGQESFFSGLSLHDEYRYVMPGTQSKDAASVSSSSTGNFKTVHMYQAEHSTKHTALTGSQASTPMPEEGVPGARLYSVAGTAASSTLSGTRSRAASGSGIPLPELATTSLSYAQRDPQLQQALSLPPVASVPNLGAATGASQKEQYPSSRSYYGLPSNETSPPVLSQGGPIFRSGSHVSAYGTHADVISQTNSMVDRTSSSKDVLAHRQAIRQQIFVDCVSPQEQRPTQTQGTEQTGEDVTERSTVAGAATAPQAPGGTLTGAASSGPQQDRTDSMCASQGPWSGSVSAPRLPVDVEKPQGVTGHGVPGSHTYTYTVGDAEEQSALFGGDATSSSSVNGAQDLSYGYYSCGPAQAPQVHTVQHVPGYYAPGFDYPSALYAPGPVPGSYVTYDGGVAYVQNAPMPGEAYPPATYATSYGGEAYYSHPPFSGTYFLDAYGNTYWSSAAPMCGTQVYMQVPEAVGTPVADTSPNEVHVSRQIDVNTGQGGDQRREGISNVVPLAYEAAPRGYSARTGSPRPHQCSVQHLLPSMASYYGSETVQTPRSEDESHRDRTAGRHEGRVQGEGDAARRGKRRVKMNWCCDAF
ncbi:proteophosphoglycan 5, related protein [Toxoplasma gondii p89]|uniref:Proteophosphoglycan 5, related protein n=2 Tax=Toxoplasma gondii TaxID=5811 RepID=A0A2T6IW88_TOXGO|nr:proteophosphoglycan 5, related protein [Toxoplasma gondii p89]PUA89595.1 proteophosphoglycan 5, related protein [Toxoplasma gondii TgCATBr9]